jgi:hypothetical protein
MATPRMMLLLSLEYKTNVKYLHVTVCWTATEVPRRSPRSKRPKQLRFSRYHLLTLCDEAVAFILRYPEGGRSRCLWHSGLYLLTCTSSDHSRT